MRIEVRRNGEEVEVFYRLHLEASCEFLRPRLRLWLSRPFTTGDTLVVKGDGQVLFTGTVQYAKNVGQSRVLVEAWEPLSKPLLLNFHKEKWSNIVKEVTEKCALPQIDFELLHYSFSGSQEKHLWQLLSLLEGYSKKDFWMYLGETGKLRFQEQDKSRGQASPSRLISYGGEAESYRPFPLLLGTASDQGIAVRLELLIDGKKERLRVWWTK